jgi:hypothetical protein
MYRSLKVFRDDALGCGPDYYGDDSVQPDKLEAAYRIYQQASAGTKLKDLNGHQIDFGVTIVGRLALREDNGTWIPSDVAFPSIDEIMLQNLKTLGEDPSDQGGILSAKDWSLLANDAWVLGGIHSRTEFHFASPLKWENLWATSAGRMTVTAREAICIMASGYAIIRPNPKLEAVAICADATRANKASLLSLNRALLEYPDSEGLQSFCRRIPDVAKRSP